MYTEIRYIFKFFPNLLKFIPLSLLIYNLDSRTIDDVTNIIYDTVRNYVGLDICVNT